MLSLTLVVLPLSARCVATSLQECSGQLCGWNGQLCCTQGQSCITDSNNQAQCISTTSTTSSTVPDASDECGTYVPILETHIQTVIMSFVVTKNHYVTTKEPCSTTASPTPTASTEPLRPTCNFALGESFCGDICCAADQYCFVANVCRKPPVQTTSKREPTSRTTIIASCPSGFDRCPDSLGGGCCRSGFICDNIFCIAPSTSSTFTTSMIEGSVATTYWTAVTEQARLVTQRKT